MMGKVLEIIREFLDPSPIKKKSYVLTKEQYAELEKILESAYEHKCAGANTV